jgi:hypothetical protein
MNFADADPRDKYWWRRLKWIIDSVAEEEDYRLLEAEHRHWITAFANSSLDDDAFELARGKSQQYLHELIITRYPEFAEQLRQSAYANSREAALAAWRERWGYPGEPRYEEMLQRSMALFKQLKEKREQEYG